MSGKAKDMGIADGESLQNAREREEGRFVLVEGGEATFSQNSINYVSTGQKTNGVYELRTQWHK